MSTLRDRVSDAVSNHPDAVVLAFACVVLFLVVTIFLWARRAARLEAAIEELTASRDALTHLLQRPESSRPDPPSAGAGRERYSIVERGPRTQREAALSSTRADAPQTAVAEPAPPPDKPSPPGGDPTVTAPDAALKVAAAKEAVAKETVGASSGATQEAVHGDTTVRLASAEIPVTWRASDDEATPAAAAWAAGPDPEDRSSEPPSPFTTVAFEPLKREAVTGSQETPGADAKSEERAAEKVAVEKVDVAEKVDAAAWSRPAEKVEPPEKTDRAAWSRPQETAGPQAPAFSFARIADEPEARAAEDRETPPAPRPPRARPSTPPAPAVRRTGEPTELEAAYDAWESLNRAPGAAVPATHDTPGDPAYAAWSELTGGNGNRRPRDNGKGNGHNDVRGQDAGLPELARVAAPSAVTPATAADATAPPPTPGAAPTSRSDGPTQPASAGGILLVEDDDNVAKIYRLVLEAKGHTVRHAPDGVAALDEVRRARPDLVLLDVMMPRMNGILFLQSLRAQPGMRELPVVILSNFREPRLVDRAMALGALEYIVKAQTRPEVLVSAVPRWMAGERAFSA